MSSSLGVMSNYGILVRDAESPAAEYSRVYNEHCHRIYSLAFWMTDNEVIAEQLAANVFLQVFTRSTSPSPELIDFAFVSTVREFATLGDLSLNCSASGSGIRGNIKRVHLERAVVQLPATEKLIFLLHDVEGYDHPKISRLLGMKEKDSQYGLHQARVQIRELVSRMQ